ncbi:glycosyltransferase family 8 protein [Cloacibacillus sp. An23]|uniref:glycosyltransferase family 8 protein n=1 Tax=Cloacibacillus sp. An23 TaxID=1965591 RepID=UPI000B3ADB55|nr:glycosyltransferase family 8 protein [Cloacibacillus sp. An23]OUO95223.1 hypothetical protein B5F39_01450 [Cloacibacillus sp. An23]
MIHIALAIHDPNGTYARHAGVVIASVLRNTENPVCFHILHDETMTAENRGKLEEVFTVNDHGGGEICFEDMARYVECWAAKFDTVCGRFTRGAMFRLCLPEALHDVDYVIYLDCDVVVNLDISVLWNERINMSDKALAGVREDFSSPEPDMSEPCESIKTDKYGIADGRYINSGVLIMNLERLRSEYACKGSLAKRAVAYAERCSPAYPDQDFLNAEYLCDILYLSRRYNEVPVEDYKDVFHNEHIWHFFSKGKPWNVVRGSNADMLYWQNLMHTPWRGELVESFYNAAVNGQYYHRHSRECIDRLARQLVENIKNIKRTFKSNKR